jgi:hypothetical protein
MDNQPTETTPIVPLELGTPPPDNGKQLPTFEGELVIEFKREDEAGQTIPSSFVTFVPKQLLRGEDKWAYPFPALAMSEDAGLTDFATHFGEEFVLDLFLDGLTKHCQGKWRQAADKDGDIVTNFKEAFFVTRRDTGPTAAKLGILLTKKMKEFKELKVKLGKDNPEVIAFAKDVRALRDEMNKLAEKEMEF